MTTTETKRALATAVTAARAAGKMMCDNLNKAKKINEASQHDIKLDLDVRCQKRIEQTLRKTFPTIPILGEEGILGDPEAPVRWVVDPIDGTVNFTYGIPHACVSIALQQRVSGSKFQVKGSKTPAAKLKARNSKPETHPFESVVGVVYDPFTDEMWTAIRGQPARMNGKVIRVSQRKTLDESIVALGFAKQRITLNKMLPVFNGLIHRVRKIRIMGAAALALVYVGTGRMDAYLEYGLRLWDIAAGGLIVECAGGEFWSEAVGDDYTYQILASNGLIARPLERASKNSLS